MSLALHKETGRPVLLFCGIPGSGKSSVAHEVAARLEKAYIAQTDAVRGMIYEPTYTNEESRMVYRMVRELGREALMSGYTLLIDGTFSKEEYRQEALRTLSGLYSKSFIVWVDCDLETAIARNNGRRSVVPADQVRKFYRGFEAPSNAIRVDTTENTAPEAAKEILRRLSAELHIPAG